MKRAVVVLLLLIANAVVSPSKSNPPAAAPSPREIAQNSSLPNLEPSKSETCLPL